MKSTGQPAQSPSPLSASSVRRLLVAATNGPTLFGRAPAGSIGWMLPGFERAMLYRLIAECGLRGEELIGLRASDVQLDVILPYITPGPLACASRQGMMLPIGGAMAAQLGEFLLEKDEQQPLFRINGVDQIERSLGFDVRAAGLEAAGINCASLLAVFTASVTDGMTGGNWAWSDKAVEVRP